MGPAESDQVRVNLSDSRPDDPIDTVVGDWVPIPKNTKSEEHERNVLQLQQFFEGEDISNLCHVQRRRRRDGFSDINQLLEEDPLCGPMALKTNLAGGFKETWRDNIEVASSEVLVHQYCSTIPLSEYAECKIETPAGFKENYRMVLERSPKSNQPDGGLGQTNIKDEIQNLPVVANPSSQKVSTRRQKAALNQGVKKAIKKSESSKRILKQSISSLLSRWV